MQSGEKIGASIQEAHKVHFTEQLGILAVQLKILKLLWGVYSVNLHTYLNSYSPAAYKELFDQVQGFQKIYNQIDLRKVSYPVFIIEKRLHILKQMTEI